MEEHTISHAIAVAASFLTWLLELLEFSKGQAGCSGLASVWKSLCPVFAWIFCFGKLCCAGWTVGVGRNIKWIADVETVSSRVSAPCYHPDSVHPYVLTWTSAKPTGKQHKATIGSRLRFRQSIFHDRPLYWSLLWLFWPKQPNHQRSCYVQSPGFVRDVWIFLTLPRFKMSGVP